VSGARHRALEALDRYCIGARDDDGFSRSASIDRRLDLAGHFRRGDQHLVVEMAAAFREILILELDCIGAGAFEQPHRALDIERIAVAGVGVDNEMRIDAVADQRHRLRDFGQTDEADVRAPEPRIGDRRARDIKRLETGLFGDQRRERIIDARRDENRRARQASAEGSFRHRSQSQISAFEFGIGSDGAGRAGHHELSFGENVGAVGNFEALHHVLLDQQDRNSVGVDAPDQR
jgi:hypothetical protein